MSILRVTYKSGANDAIGDELRRQIAELQNTYGSSAVVQSSGKGARASQPAATLILHGAFKYWWFQEFGVGQYFNYQGGAASPLKTPAGVMGPEFGGLDAASIDIEATNAAGNYLVGRAARRALGRKQITDGRYLIRKNGSGLLAYYKSGPSPQLRRARYVWHPGFKAWQAPDTPFFGSGDSSLNWGQGLIRSTLAQMRKNISSRVKDFGKRIEREMLKKWATKRKFNLRQEILLIINDEMRKTVQKLHRYTPRSSGPVVPRGNMNKPGHVGDAWDYIAAQ